MPALHTPEPWEIEYDNDGNGHYREWLRVGPATIDVTRAEGAEHERGYADARLIRAAPEMLALLRRIADRVEHEGVFARDDERDAILLRDTRALLAKVEGK